MIKKQKRALVISGGGAMGAFGCGVAEGLIKVKNYEYDLLIGTSTGSLQMSLVGLKKFNLLRKAYLDITQDDIFSWNPFNKKGDINPFKALWRFIRKKDTLGDSGNLLKRIKNFISEEDYNLLSKREIEVVSVVANMNTSKSEFKSSKTEKYEDMLEWIWASANAPVFMSNLYKDGDVYVDGGIKDHVGISHAIDKGYKDIDVIVHRTKEYERENFGKKGILYNLMRVITVLTQNTSIDDIETARLKAKEQGVNLNIYYTPYKLTENSLMFDKNIMSDWWELGYKQIVK